MRQIRPLNEISLSLNVLRTRACLCDWSRRSAASLQSSSPLSPLPFIISPEHTGWYFSKHCAYTQFYTIIINIYLSPCYLLSLWLSLCGYMWTNYYTVLLQVACGGWNYWFWGGNALLLFNHSLTLFCRWGADDEDYQRKSLSNALLIRVVWLDSQCEGNVSALHGIISCTRDLRAFLLHRPVGFWK